MTFKGQLILAGLVAMLIGMQLAGAGLETNAASLLVNDIAAVRQTRPAGTFKQAGTLKSLRQQGVIRLSGGWEWSDNGDALSRFNDAAIEGSFTGSRLDLQAELKNQTFELELDRAAARTIVTPDTGVYGNVNLAENLPATSHTFLLHLLNRAGKPLAVSGLLTDGSWNKSQYARRVRLMGYGSSTVDGSGLTWKLAQARGWECINRGIGGTTVINEGQHRVERDVLPFQPDVVLVNYGSNDWFGNLPLDKFKQGFQEMLNRLATGLPGTDIVVLGLFPRQGGNETTRPRFNQAMQDALKESAAAGRASYLEIAGYNWDGMTVDGTHPNKQTISGLFLPQILPQLNPAEPLLAADNRP